MPVRAKPFPASKVLPSCPSSSEPLKTGRKYLPDLGFYDPASGDTHVSRHLCTLLCFVLRTYQFHSASSGVSAAPDWLGAETLQNYVKQDSRADMQVQD